MAASDDALLGLTAVSALQVGFNMGTSAAIVLSSNPSARVISFDLLQFAITHAAVHYLHATFPGRLSMVRGDSRSTIARFAALHPEVACDVIFVDGGHSTEIALSDFRQFRELAHSETKVIADDMQSDGNVASAWGVAIAEGLIVELSVLTDSDVADAKDRSNVEVTQGALGVGRYAQAVRTQLPL